MADGFIVRRGGTGGGNVFAFIVVTYPAGSTCTCTDGTKTLTAKDTSGSYVFEIPYAGTWTVSCTDGQQMVSQSVNISSKGQSEDVRLAYDLILYDRGYTETAISGGLSHSGYAYASGNMRSPTINEDNLHFAGSPNYQGIGTANKINFSGYSKLKAIIKPTNAALTAHPWLGINASKAVTTALARVFPTEANVENTVVADLSGLSVTEAYVFIFLTSSDATGYLYKLWLER